MRINSSMNEQAIFNELAARFKQTRIDSSVTREELADKAMVSVGTIARFESGKDISLKNVLKLLKALNLDGTLDILIPDPFDRPSYHLATVSPKKRARKKEKKTEWKWGDEK